MPRTRKDCPYDFTLMKTGDWRAECDCSWWHDGPVKDDVWQMLRRHMLVKHQVRTHLGRVTGEN